jgi:hypothetical protein
LESKKTKKAEVYKLIWAKLGPDAQSIIHKGSIWILRASFYLSHRLQETGYYSCTPEICRCRLQYEWGSKLFYFVLSPDQTKTVLPDKPRLERERAGERRLGAEREREREIWWRLSKHATFPISPAQTAVFSFLLSTTSACASHLPFSASSPFLTSTIENCNSSILIFNFQ